MEKLSDFFSGVKMTLVGGAFLAASFILLLTQTAVAVDPAWATVIICGLPLFHAAFAQLFFQRRISSATLISTAMIAAVYIGELFAAGEVAFIMAIGEILEDKTAERAKRGIKKLISLAPTHGRLVGKDGESIILAQDIKVGDILRVLPGETIPVDGKIVSGNTSIDQSVMTGESLPVDKSAGDEVFCGTINRFGAIDIEALKVGRDSSFEKLVAMVKDAENNKSPSERIADRWASWLVPAALAIAVVTYFISGDISRAVTVLVVFCPCALVLATPTSVMAAIGQAAKYGVIIKSGAALEMMGKVDCIAFDKTGTLTYGKLAISDIVSFAPAYSEAQILSFAASVEALSEHPLGKAVSLCAKERGAKTYNAKDFKMMPGRGIKAIVDAHEILCGNADFLRENGVAMQNLNPAINSMRAEGKAVILVAVDKLAAGAIGLSDIIRESAISTMEELRQTDTETVLLTGDNSDTAAFFASKTGIKKVHSQLLPSQKVEEIKRLRAQGLTVCMIGDGVNDAPALKTADVGVAMGAMGSDIAVDAADIALMGDDISKIPYLKRLSNAAVWSIKFNISLSMIINFAAIILSVMALLNPVTGALVHNLGSVLVVLNAGLLYDRNYIKKR